MHVSYKQACMQEIGPSCDLNTQVFSHKVKHCTPAHPSMAKKNKNKLPASSVLVFISPTAAQSCCINYYPLESSRKTKQDQQRLFPFTLSEEMLHDSVKIAYSYLKVALTNCVVGSVKQISTAERKRLQKLLWIYSRFKWYISNLRGMNRGHKWAQFKEKQKAAQHPYCRVPFQPYN